MSSPESLSPLPFFASLLIALFDFDRNLFFLPPISFSIPNFTGDRFEEEEEDGERRPSCERGEMALRIASEECRFLTDGSTDTFDTAPWFQPTLLIGAGEPFLLPLAEDERIGLLEAERVRLWDGVVPIF